MAVELNFREKGIPKWIKKRIKILTIIFVMALIVFQFVLNRSEHEKNIEMQAATLPTVSVQANGVTMGELHGYVTQMDACYMRDAIIPIGKKRKMDMIVHSYGYDVKGISYEIRSLDTERKIADTKIDKWTTSGDDLKLNIQVESLIDEGEEYLFVLILHGENQDINYYTRIMRLSDGNEKKCLEFAKQFHETALSEHYLELSSYVETSDYSDKDTLADVGIDSSIDQIGWQGFKGEILGEPIVEITDINDDYITLVYDYQMQSKEEDDLSIYNVEEYFKMRYTAEQIYLLDYHRTMEQILQAGNVGVSDNVINLGVTTKDLEYLSNETGTIVSFVQAGELFEYNQNKQTLTKVFGFMEDPTDIRQSYQEHNIRILNIDETGNMDFVVYGYMNRGSHEGECGINLFHYDSGKEETIEQVFISSTRSYQILNANFSDLLYENAKGDFYIMLGGTLAKVGLDNLSTEEMITGLKTDQYAVSASGEFVAWITDGVMGDEISIIDLETEKVKTITANKGQKIKPLAFMTEDFVYGIANESDIKTDVAGTLVYPMKEVRIVNTSSSNFEVLKSYEKPGYYVTEVEKVAYTLYLDRVTKTAEGFAEAPEDTIKDSAGEQNKTVDVLAVANKAKGSVIELTMAKLAEEDKIHAIAENQAQMAVASQSKNLSVETSSQEETYFVYVGSRVTMTTQNLHKAITEADAEMGIVVDNRQKYIWKRGKKPYVNAFADIEVGALDGKANSSAGALSAMLAQRGEHLEVHSQLENGKTPVSILQNTLKDQMVLDLTGCTLSEVLYYVNKGTPVYARTGENEAVLLIGYDAANVIVYQPTSDSYRKIAMDQGTQMFEDAGNVFISYVE